MRNSLKGLLSYLVLGAVLGSAFITFLTLAWFFPASGGRDSLSAVWAAVSANPLPAVGGGIALLVLAWLLSMRIGTLLGPLRRLEKGARLIALGHIPPPLPGRAEGELARLADSLNQVRERNAALDRELRETAHRLRTLLEQTVDAVLLFDRTGRLTEANAKALRLTGLERDSLLGRDIVSLVPGERHTQEDVYHRFMRCLKGASEVFETRIVRADGQHVPVEVSAGPISGLSEPLVQAVVRDVSGRKRMEAQLAQMEKMEGIGTLAGGIAHDFNNILGGILGYAALLRSHLGGSERLGRYVEIIERSATRASELTQQLLGYARGGKYQVTLVQPNAVVEEVGALLRQSLMERNIEFVARLDPFLPGVEADPGQLHQVLMNLCVNARDAMPQGGTLTVESASEQVAAGDHRIPLRLAPGRYVRLTVTDTGHGMAPETQRKMFEPFFTTKPPGEGTGLGLAMVYGIVRNHGGQIAVDSEPGRGTTISLFLPAREAASEAPAPAAPFPRDEKRVEPSAGGSERILMVDDEVTLLELAREILSAQGYGVVMARDGEEAVHIYEQYGESIDLVVLDIVMPRMGGKETYTRLKELNPHVKVVVSSGFSRHGQAHDLLEMGADAFIQKPFRPEDLTAVVRQTLDAPTHAGPGGISSL